MNLILYVYIFYFILFIYIYIFMLHYFIYYILYIFIYYYVDSKQSRVSYMFSPCIIFNAIRIFRHRNNTTIFSLKFYIDMTRVKNMRR